MSRYTVLAALSLVTLAATACSSSGGDDPSDPAAAPTTALTQPTATTTTTTTTATATTTTEQGIASGEPNPAQSRSATSPCLESQLRATIDSRKIPGNGTKGSDGRTQHAVLVDFENKSGSTCTLYGYPGAAIEDSANKQVQQAKRTLRGPLGGLPDGQNTPTRVSLKPGASAAAFLEGVDTREQGAAQAGCDAPRYPRILVTPPNTDTPVPFSVGWPQCYSFAVHPVRSLS